MSSPPGQLDWIFGKLEKSEHSNLFRSASLHIEDENGQLILDLGPFDFLPLILRQPFQNLTDKLKKQLSPFHVHIDLHESLHAAKTVLATDLRVSDPKQTRHSQTTCIQCHSSQERIERAQSFIQHGGAKDFGYFMRGMGLIDHQPYVSWRSIQESRHLDQQIKQKFASNN